MKKLFLLGIILFLLINIIALRLLFVEEGGRKRGRFYWALTSVVDIEGGRNIRQLEQTSVIPATPGINLKAFFRPMENAHLYLLLFDSDNKLTIHFPDTSSSYDSCYETFSREIPLEIPDLPGRNKLYLLISATRLESVEKLLNRYRLLEGDYSSEDSVEKEKISGKLLTLIRKMSRNIYFSDEQAPAYSDEAAFDNSEIELGIDMVKLVNYEDLYVKYYIIEKE